MPQIVSSDYLAMKKELKAEGITTTNKKISLDTLKPIQKEINFASIERLVKDKPAKLYKPLLVSKDNYLLDGHHRWLAMIMIDDNIKSEVIQINLPVKEALNALRNVSVSHFKDVNNNVFKAVNKKMKVHINEEFSKFFTERKAQDDDPSIVVSGFGKMRLSQAKEKVKKDFNELNKRLQNDDYNAVDVMLSRGNIQAFLKAIKANS